MSAGDTRETIERLAALVDTLTESELVRLLKTINRRGIATCYICGQFSVVTEFLHHDGTHSMLLCAACGEDQLCGWTARMTHSLPDASTGATGFK